MSFNFKEIHCRDRNHCFGQRKFCLCFFHKPKDAISEALVAMIKQFINVHKAVFYYQIRWDSFPSKDSPDRSQDLYIVECRYQQITQFRVFRPSKDMLENFLKTCRIFSLNDPTPSPNPMFIQSSSDMETAYAIMTSQPGTSLTGETTQYIDLQSIPQQHHMDYSYVASSTSVTPRSFHQSPAPSPQTPTASNVEHRRVSGVQTPSLIRSSQRNIQSTTPSSTSIPLAYFPRQSTPRTVARYRRERTPKRHSSSASTATVPQSPQRSHSSTTKRIKLTKIHDVVSYKVEERFSRTKKHCLVEDSELCWLHIPQQRYTWNIPRGPHPSYEVQMRKNLSDSATVMPTDPPDNFPWNRKHRRK